MQSLSFQSHLLLSQLSAAFQKLAGSIQQESETASAVTQELKIIKSRFEQSESELKITKSELDDLKSKIELELAQVKLAVWKCKY